MARDGQYSHGASQKSWAIDCLLHCCPTHLSREGASAAGWWPTSSQKHRLLQKVGRTGFDWWAVKFETNLIWIWSHLGFQLSFASRVSWPTVLATYHHAILNTLAARLNIDSSRGKSLCFWFSFGILQHKPRNINIINQHNEFQSVTQKNIWLTHFRIKHLIGRHWCPCEICSGGLAGALGAHGHRIHIGVNIGLRIRLHCYNGSLLKMETLVSNYQNACLFNSPSPVVIFAALILVHASDMRAWL